MKILIAVVIILLTSTSVFAATAYWTGQQKSVQTVTHQHAWSCKYIYAGQTFWKVFKKSCPSKIEVQ